MVRAFPPRMEEVRWTLFGLTEHVRLERQLSRAAWYAASKIIGNPIHPNLGERPAGWMPFLGEEGENETMCLVGN